MSNVILYDELTWPEISSLPRDIPLVIPLGTGYDLEQFCLALGNPETIIFLPPFPFGWVGSGLEVADDYLEAYISNLITSLREDGFTRVYALTPQGINLSLGANQISLDHPNQWQPLPGLPSDLDVDKVVLIPIGHTEQHSYHLPMSTDTLIISAISQGVVKACRELCVNLPVMPYGVSTHRSSFCGTLNAGGRAFEDFWLDIVQNLVVRGFNRIYFINGHS